MFGRRRKQPANADATVVARGNVLTSALPTQATGYVTGWRAAGTGQAPNEQIGAYSAPMLTMRAGNVQEIQRRQGVEGLSSGWYVPPLQVAAAGMWITQRAGGSGRQLTGGATTGQLGPITARRMRALVNAQQIRQSGLSAVQWAQSLSPQ